MKAECELVLGGQREYREHGPGRQELLDERVRKNLSGFSQWGLLGRGTNGYLEMRNGMIFLLFKNSMQYCRKSP